MPPTKYTKQAKTYVGEGRYVDPKTSPYGEGSKEYRDWVLQQRGQNFKAAGGGDQDEWRLLEETGTGKRYWRHYDKEKKQYDEDLYDAAEENTAEAVAKRDPKQFKAGVYDEGEQIEARANPYPPGTTAYANFQQAEYQKVLDARGKHYTPTVSNEADPSLAQQEWRQLRNNDTGYYQNRRFDIASNQYDLNLGQAYNEKGVIGGAGNRVAGKSVNNKWDVATSGADVRTDEQKYYDRDFSKFGETADAEGHYSWYGSDDKGAQTNLDTLDDPSKPKVANRTQYWDYNGAPDEAWFTDQARNRKNMSVYARTA